MSAGVALAEEHLAVARSATFDAQPAISSSALRSDRPWKSGTSLQQGLNRLASVASSLARIAVSSSVTSIPTGHQVMQRPQPTQPEVPNWSCQVPNLCVSHWR